MDLGLEGKVALVTGASKGIGRAIAAELVVEGARVAVSSRSRERIEETAGAIGAVPFVHDGSDLDAVPRLVDDVVARLGPIDVLVCNTGGPPGGSRASSGRTRTRASCSVRWRSSRRWRPACANAASDAC